MMNTRAQTLNTHALKRSEKHVFLKSSNSNSNGRRRRSSRGAALAAASNKNYKLTLLPGDGIGPEIMKSPWMF